MADPTDPKPRGNWLWLLLIALLAVLLVVWMLSPSGERDGEVEDPVLTEELGEPEAGALGDGLPTAGADETVPGDAPVTSLPAADSAATSLNEEPPPPPAQ